jgi:Histidine kinase-, DNA gyrase B-, and HSP90-like ATPase
MNLFGLETFEEKIDRREIAKRTLNNLLTSYADEADLFAEIIQNSYDAVVQGIRENLYTTLKPRITIAIGRRLEGPHYLFVSDNGIGMSPEVATNLTVPGYSRGKRKGKTVGYKGVGASYFFAASRRIALSTIDRNGQKTEFTVLGSYDWIKDDEAQEPRVEPSCEIPAFPQSLLPSERGTAIYFQFHEGIRPNTLNNLVIRGNGDDAEIMNWASFLASKTALGTTESDLGQTITVEFFLDKGDSQKSQLWQIGRFDRDNKVLGYPFPHQVFKVSKSIDEINATPEERRYQHEKRYQAVHKRWSAEEILNDTSLDTEEKERLLQSLNWVDGYLCYSTDVLKEVNARLGGRSSLIRHGMKISVDGSPQGRTLDLSLTSSQGLDRQSHIVFSFQGLELDTGRKISADEIIASSISKIGQRVIAVLKEYRWAMKKKDRPDVSSDLAKWRTDIEVRSQSSLVRELFKALGKTEVFSVDPGNESEVIALYVALVTRQLIKGCKLRAISGFQRYDSLVDIDVSDPGVLDLNDGLSIRNPEAIVSGTEKVLEFKHSFEELLDDFDDKVKNPQEIDLLVCWTVPNLNVRRGRLEPTYGEWRDNRALYSATYVWLDENETSSFPVIALKNVVAELLQNLEKQSGDDVRLGAATLGQLQRADRDALI